MMRPQTKKKQLISPSSLSSAVFQKVHLVLFDHNFQTTYMYLLKYTEVCRIYRSLPKFTEVHGILPKTSRNLTLSNRKFTVRNRRLTVSNRNITVRNRKLSVSNQKFTVSNQKFTEAHKKLTNAHGSLSRSSRKLTVILGRLRNPIPHG